VGVLLIHVNQRLRKYPLNLIWVIPAQETAVKKFIFYKAISCEGNGFFVFKDMALKIY